MSGFERLAQEFTVAAPEDSDFWSLRLEEVATERLIARQSVLEPPVLGRTLGAMVTVVDSGGIGYGATSELSVDGLLAAYRTARQWARVAGAAALFDAACYPRATGRGHDDGQSPGEMEPGSRKERQELVSQASDLLAVDSRIVDRHAVLNTRWSDSYLVTSAGAALAQRRCILSPAVTAIARDRGQIQRRTGCGVDAPGQGGLEHLARIGFPEQAPRIAEEAVALCSAPECPTGARDLVLMPDQMLLQIHESIGHPLELDRILGDERNYAGGSFVTPDLFGHYQYGTALLNITFDPTPGNGVGAYQWDDEGTLAQHMHLIRNGVLERPIGGALSQARAGVAGPACARATAWNRPPIDRMANINMEPGSDSLADLVGGIEQGVLMATNRSWSIDDRRYKFQFGCEAAWRIVNGECRELLRNPGYRGITSRFWHALDGVGDATTWWVHGVMTCGKGEPNQAIHAGHGSPACRFRNVEVFGDGG